jgi:hypothetical protein
MTATMCPGPVRMFDVEPGDRDRIVYRVVACDVGEIATARKLAAAVAVAATYSAETERTVWVCSPDRWACQITHTGDGWIAEQTGTTGAAPLDAIRRVLARIAIPTTTGDNP